MCVCVKRLASLHPDTFTVITNLRVCVWGDKKAHEGSNMAPFSWF